MHAIIIHVQIKPGQLDEFVQSLNTSVLPMLKQEPGFKSFLLLTENDQHIAHGISLWETEAHMRQRDPARGNFRDWLASHAHFHVAPPVIEYTEVRVQE